VIYFGQTCAVPSVRFRTLLQAHSSRKTNAQTLLRLHGWHKNFCVSQVALKQSEPCAQLRAVPSVLFEPLSENSFWPRVGTLDASLLRELGRWQYALNVSASGPFLRGLGGKPRIQCVVSRGVSTCKHHRAWCRSTPQNHSDKIVHRRTKLSRGDFLPSLPCFGRSRLRPASQQSQRLTSARPGAGCVANTSRPYRSSSPSFTKCCGNRQNSICEAA
jgi:hypothetical protein